MGLPFFMLGYFLNKIKISDKSNNILLIVNILLFYLEIFIVNNLNLQRDIIITIFLYPLIFTLVRFLLNHNLEKCQRFSAKCRNIANWMYYSHILVMSILSFIFNKINIGDNPTVLFFNTVTLCILSEIIIEKTDNKFIKMLYE